VPFLTPPCFYAEVAELKRMHPVYPELVTRKLTARYWLQGTGWGVILSRLRMFFWFSVGSVSL
jgi:hypothetical protein